MASHKPGYWFGIFLVLALLVDISDCGHKPGDKLTKTDLEDLDKVESALSDELPPGPPVLFTQGATSNVFDVEYNRKWQKDLKIAQWKSFWKPFFLGCKAEVFEKWFGGKWDKDEGGGGAGAAALVAADTKAWHTSAYKGKTPIYASHQSYIVDLADFYYDEEMEQAKQDRAWRILDGERERAERANARNSRYADDLWYDYYDNVDMEMEREQEAMLRLQRERKRIEQQKNHNLKLAKRKRARYYYYN